MNTNTCTTIVLVLLWLYLCCQALGFLVSLIDAGNATTLPTTTILSTALLGLCLWQCRQAGYLVSPMTWYHWVLLVLLVLLQVLAVVIEYLGLQGMFSSSIGKEWAYPIYGVAVVILAILGGTLFCGWKCNLFCRPCCKSQYICYGSAIVVVLVVLIVLGVTVLLAMRGGGIGFHIGFDLSFATGGDTEKSIIQYLGNMAVPIMQCYSTAIIWNTTVKLPYTVPEVVALIASAVAVSSLLSLAVLGGTHLGGVQLSSKGYPFIAVHLLALGITLYCLEYKAIFPCPKLHLCFGILAVVLLLALVVVATQIATDGASDVDVVSYVLLGYSILLIIPTLWYAYRCGLLTWRWNSCLPKKKGLKATDTAENTVPETDIAKES
ncbi:putative integral membrane protein [Babesia bovis T2Bo]|uniref:Membrane protein, putative n=1 Tax=Babesia bovis TaxID=5865 RepID=A7ASQ2_BABBO|nr:putative integral membrane protein [Babesia bovis T2Bo]EDO05963.1 putative integral membrane protein [Babesia bovis T2Bo]|eukprot:XP_001609531.1 membrane protein [Babesia bovis T2Bo]